MNQGILSGETFARRATVGAAIIGAHIGLILLAAASGFVAPTLVQSVTVTFMPDEPKQPDKPAFVEPSLRPIQQILIPPPEVVVAVEPENAISATTEPQPAPAASSP